MSNVKTVIEEWSVKDLENGFIAEYPGSGMHRIR
jgi:hypothetical protein